MKFNYVTLMGIALLCASCARETGVSTAPASVPLTAVVSRGPQNQPMIRIEGKTLPGEGYKADLLLAETDGYVSAQDRFVQMDLLRRIGRGRLAEVFPSQIAQDRDKLMIGVGIPLSVEKSGEKMQTEFPEVYALLEAYTRGVNRFIAEIPTHRPEILRMFQGFSHAADFVIPNWEPKDSIAVATNVSFYLSSKLQQKLDLGIISLIMRVFSKDDQLTELFDFRPIEKTFIVGNKTNLPPTLQIPTRKLRSTKIPSLKDRLSQFKWECKEYGYPVPECKRSSGVGSNNWTISKAYAGNDTTLLANDPHLPITFPATFLEMSGDSKSAGGSLRVRGVKPPGIPGILIGHNDDIGWGMTNLGADVDNIYVEDMSDGTKTRYRWGKNYKKVTTIPIPYRKRLNDGKLDTSETIYLKVVDEHGPIFSELIPELRDRIVQVEALGVLGNHLALSYKWVGHRGTTEFAGMLGLNRAKNYQEFRGALDHFQVGTQNTIYADKKGHIGYYAHGFFPMRPYVMEKKYLPYEFVFAPTLEGSREWSPIPRAEMPEKFKTDGFIVTANNDPFGHSARPDLSNYNDYFGYDFTDGIRAARITQLIEDKKAEKGSLDLADMQKIQTDKKDLLAIRLLDLLEKSQVKSNLTDAGKAYFDKMMAWKASGAWAHMDQSGPVYFYEWMPLLMAEWFKLGPIEDSPFPTLITNAMKTAYDLSISDLYVSSVGIKTLYNKVNDGLASGSGPNYEKVMLSLKTSLELATLALSQTGKEKLSWGEVNILVFEDLLGGLIPPLFNLHVGRGGAYETVDPAAPGRGFGANFRMLLSLKEGEPISAKITIPGGNYGPLEPAKAISELMLWRDGDLRDMVPFNTP